MADEFSRDAVARRLSICRVAAYGLRGQTALAGLLGVQPTRYNNWERGAARLPPEIAVKISQLFGVDVAYLYQGNCSNLSVQKLEELKRAEHLFDADSEKKLSMKKSVSK